MQKKVSQRHDFVQDFSLEHESIVSSDVQNFALSQWIPPIQSSIISTTDLSSINLDDTYSTSTSYLNIDPSMNSSLQYSVNEDRMNVCQSVLPNLGIDKFFLFENGKSLFSANDNTTDLIPIDCSNEETTIPNTAIFSTSFIAENSVPSMIMEDISSVSGKVYFKSEIGENNNMFFPETTVNFSKKIETSDEPKFINNSVQTNSNIIEDLHLIITSDDKYKSIEDEVTQFLVTDGQPGISYSISKENGFLIARPKSICTLPKTGIPDDVTSMDVSILESFEDLTTNINTVGLNKNTDKTDINGNLENTSFFMNESNVNYIPYKVNDLENNKSPMHIMDKSVPVRALASLPASYLTVKLDKGGNPCGVLSCKLILPKVRFGPLEGIHQIVSSENVIKCKDPYFFIQKDNNVTQINVSDEQTSNWMRYVHFEPGIKQNLVVEQIGQELYFITCSLINSGTELVLGYGSYYQRKWNSIFPELFKEKEPKLDWPCCKCAKEFASCFELNTHLDIHREEELENIQELDVKPGKTILNEISEKLSDDDKNTDLITAKELQLLKENSEKDEDTVKNNIEMNYSLKQYTCQYCKKNQNGFDNFINHVEVHFTEENLSNCPLCSEYLKDLCDFKNHMLSHNDLHNNFKCILCSITFFRQHELTNHTKSVHQRSDGKFSCPICEPIRVFLDYNGIKKHIKALHGIKRFECEDCHCKFSSSDKLQAHSTKHLDVKNIECPICNKQFKRKDKLTAHLKNPHVHLKNEINMTNSKHGSTKNYVSHSTSYTKYTFKCHSCHLGFKRRGMLVNHFARCHPEISRANVPELQLPILKTTRDYYCQHCEKVYKSSSKRKAHILKNHPGESIPPSNRGVDLGLGEYGKVGGVGYTACVGTISITPHHCPYDPCHKQYASKAKLLQHIRSKHLSKINNTKENGNVFSDETSMNNFDNDDKTLHSSSTQKSMESNLKHSVDVHDNMSILKSKLINMPVDCFYSNLNKKPGTAVEVDEKEILIKPDSLSSKNKKDIIITNTSLLENKNFSLGQVLNLHTKLPPVSIFTSSITEITSLSQYTDR